MSNLSLKNNLTLKDLQEYIIQMEKERGFTTNTILQNALMLGEEVGELFKAIRKQEKMRTDANSNLYTVEEELVDIMMYVTTIANRYNIDLEDALRKKEEKNKRRIWK